MRTVDIQNAKANLSRLVSQAAKGESFIIAKAGEPLVKVVPIDLPASAEARRVGFMAGQFSVPDDFDRLGRDEIEQRFDRGM